MFKDYQLSDQPFIRGIILAFFLSAIAAIIIVFGFIPLAGLLVIAITMVPIRAVVDKVVIGSKDQVLTFSIGVSPSVLLAVASMVAWLSYPADAGDPMGAVLPAVVGVNMTLYSLAILILGAWEIIAANRTAKTNNSRER